MGLEKRIETQVEQAATKWKRFALKQFLWEEGEGICTDMRAIRKDYFLDHDHSVYVDQWDWERVINAGDRTPRKQRETKINELVKSRKPVTPAKAGVHNRLEFLDSRFRGNDRYGAKRTFYEHIKIGSS